MGGSRTGPTTEQPGASRQRSSREWEPVDKGAEPRDPRVAIIQGRIWGPLSKGGHYPRVDHGSTIQGWPLSKCGSGVHYPRVATIQGWPLSKSGSGVHYPRVATIPGSAKLPNLKLGQDGDQGGKRTQTHGEALCDARLFATPGPYRKFIYRYIYYRCYMH